MHTLRRKLHLDILRLLGREKVTFAPHGIVVSVPREADVKLRYDLARGRPYEAAEAKMIETYLRFGTPVIELGGCLGIVSALIRRQIGPDATHIVVEAKSELARICAANARIGATDAAVRVVVAAIDYSGTQTVSFSTGKTAHGGHVSTAGELRVPAITLSSLAAAMPAGQFALVCDIEGAELAMVEREDAVLRRVDLLILETHPKSYPAGVADRDRMIAMIQSNGLRQVAQDKNVYAFKR